MHAVKKTNTGKQFQDKAKALFFDLKNRFGSGGGYHKIFPHERVEAVVQHLSIRKGRRSIAMIQYKDHVKILFFMKRDPYLEGWHEDIVAIQIDAGKLAPHGENIGISVRYRNDLDFARDPRFVEAIAGLGPFVMVGETPHEQEEGKIKKSVSTFALQREEKEESASYVHLAAC